MAHNLPVIIQIAAAVNLILEPMFISSCCDVSTTFLLLSNVQNIQVSGVCVVSRFICFLKVLNIDHKGS